MFSMKYRKNITVAHNKKRMNTAKFIKIYIQIYIPILQVTRMTQNKNESINSILQHGCVLADNVV